MKLAYLSVVFLTGCAVQPIVAVPAQEEQEYFSVCEPKRGEEQDVIRQSKGKAFNSTTTGCI